MPPQLSGPGHKPKIVQCLTDLHVRLSLISKFCGLGSDLGIHRAAFLQYLIFWPSWFWSWRRRFQVGNQEYPNGGWATRCTSQHRCLSTMTRRAFTMTTRSGSNNLHLSMRHRNGTITPDWRKTYGRWRNCQRLRLSHKTNLETERPR